MLFAQTLTCRDGPLSVRTEALLAAGTRAKFALFNRVHAWEHTSLTMRVKLYKVPVRSVFTLGCQVWVLAT
jgi:hypothetical protein